MGADFPNDFLWGVATAGHQSEGNNSNSDTWFLESVRPSIFREPSGAACNSYALWETDLDLAAGLGLDAYRFSVEWARVEPAEGQFDDAALEHYERVVDGALQRGLAPIVTFNHFTAPHWFAARAGWLAEDSHSLFARYCDTAMARFGDRIAMAVTLNEPNLPRLITWVLPDFVIDLQRATLVAASAAAGVERYRAANVVAPEDFDSMDAALTRAHRAAREAIKSRRPDLPVGLSIAVVDDVAAGDSSVRDRKRRDVYQHWLELAREDDFLGVQNYERIHYDANGPLPVPDGAVINEMGSAVDPDSLGGSVRYAWSEAGVPILVSEHGVATADDRVRFDLLEPALESLAAAISDGVPVIGYCHWTLMDNFEWVSGYDSILGLHSVDRETFERTPKPSAAEYARLVALHRAH